jgi:hypothetical protein
MQRAIRRRWWVCAGWLIGCAGAAPAVDAPASAAPDALPCAGRQLQTSQEVPGFVSTDGVPLTVGVALSCVADHLEAADWGLDSSASFVIDRDHAMEVWDAFATAGTLDERRAIILSYL